MMIRTSGGVLSCGIAFNYHDSSVAFAINERVVLVLEAERIFREKKKACSREEMEYLVRYGLALLNRDGGDVAYPSFKHFVAPCCDDTGQSLGALCILIAEVFHTRPIVDFPYLGEGKVEISYTQETLDVAVDILLNDGILILHNGKAEIGPRALGNRSFIARPDKLEVKKRLSEGIKKREPYRPVAPVVMEGDVGKYFSGPSSSPFMLYRYEVKKQWSEKIIGAVHVDKSARVQTVTRHSNPFLYDLIKTFGTRTGISVLLNTSLNFKGQPLTNRIQESMDIYEKIEGSKGVIYNGALLKKHN
jgi:carbamoyltransferase